MWETYVIEVGQGFCRDANGENNWVTDGEGQIFCTNDLSVCRETCLDFDCACFAFAETPPTEDNGCLSAGQGKCVIYVGTTVAYHGSGHVGYIAYTPSGKDNFFVRASALHNISVTCFNSAKIFSFNAK